MLSTGRSMPLKKDGFGSRFRRIGLGCASTAADHRACVIGDALIKNGRNVTWCCGPSLGWRSGSSGEEPIVKLPPGIETISRPAPEPSPSVKILAVFFSGGFRIPLASTVTVSKVIVRNGGFDSSLRMEGAALVAPAPATASAAIPSACRRVRLIGRVKNRRRGSAVGAIEEFDADERSGLLDLSAQVGDVEIQPSDHFPDVRLPSGMTQLKPIAVRQ